MTLDLVPAVPIALAFPDAAAPPYQYPQVENDGSLVLEPGEAIQMHLRKSLRIKGEEISSQTPVFVTDRRMVWIEPNWAKGTGLSAGAELAGTLVLGVGVNLVDDAVRKVRANRQSRQVAGTFAVGQIRYEWLHRVAFRKQKPLLGSADSYLDLDLHGSSARTTIHFGASSANTTLAEGAAEAVARAALQWIGRVDRLAPPAPTGSPMLAFATSAEAITTKQGRTWTIRNAPPPMLADAVARAHRAWLSLQD